MVTVRRATTDDIPWLTEQAHAFSQTLHFKRPLFTSDAQVGGIFSGLIANHVVLIATDSGVGRMGVIAGIKSPHHFNPDIRCLVELIWWVPEEFRDGRAGVALMREFEKVGRSEADCVVMSLEVGSTVRADHLTKHGYRLAERSFVLEV